MARECDLIGSVVWMLITQKEPVHLLAMPGPKGDRHKKKEISKRQEILDGTTGRVCVAVARGCVE